MSIVSPPLTTPQGIFRFDMQRGTLETHALGTNEVLHGKLVRLVPVPESVLATMVLRMLQAQDTSALFEFGKMLGEHVRPVAECSLHQAAQAIGARLALFGWGALSLERWGDLLVLRLESPPQLDRQQSAIEALLAGVLEGCLQLSAACVMVEASMFAVVDPSCEAAVRGWKQRGISLPGLLARLARPQEETLS